MKMLVGTFVLMGPAFPLSGVLLGVDVMLQPKKWWIGLLPLGLVWGVANWVETPKVEADILSRAKQALAVAAKDMTRSEITVSGRDITLSGEAVKSDVPQNASGAAEQLRGTRLVHAAVSTAQVQRPYTLGAERDGNAVTLSGFAPAADVKDKLAAAARSASGGSIKPVCGS